MSARDELAAVIVEAYGESPDECPCEQDLDVADAILAAGYSKPRTITTAEELDALHDGSVVMNCFGDASTIHWELRERNDTAYHHLIKHGPATVLYSPDPA